MSREEFVKLIQSGKTIYDFEKELIRSALFLYDGNKSKAAKAIGISTRTIRRKMDGYRFGEIFEENETEVECA